MPNSIAHNYCRFVVFPVALVLVAAGPGTVLGSPPAGRTEGAVYRPHWIRLSLVGDTATQVAIAWNAADATGDVMPPAQGAQTAAEVAFGLAPDGLHHRASGSCGPAVRRLGPVCEVLISGLQPSTRYFYRVGSPRRGSVQSFRTGPATATNCARFRFAYVGDSRAESWQTGQGANAAWPATLRLIANHDPLFLLHGGDFIQDGRRPGQWRQYLGATEPFSRGRAIMYALGNHDDGPRVGERALYNQLLVHPRAEPALGGSGTEDFYAFEVGNAIFVSISTVTFANGDPPFSRQARWLDRVLQRSDKRWKVLFMHHPIYTENLFYNHPPNQVGHNRAFVEVINRHAVDLVIGSHNHFYERFKPSRCADPASERPCPSADPRATVYLTSGGGGAFPVFAPGRPNETRLAVSGAHHFLLFEIDNATLRMEAIDTDGLVFDRWTRSHHTPAACTRPE